MQTTWEPRLARHKDELEWLFINLLLRFYASCHFCCQITFIAADYIMLFLV